jgi:hypothetical protein
MKQQQTLMASCCHAVWGEGYTARRWESQHYGSKQQNSANSMDDAEGDPKPQRKTQAHWHLELNLMRPWAENPAKPCWTCDLGDWELSRGGDLLHTIETAWVLQWLPGSVLLHCPLYKVHFPSLPSHCAWGTLIHTLSVEVLAFLAGLFGEDLHWLHWALPGDPPFTLTDSGSVPHAAAHCCSPSLPVPQPVPWFLRFLDGIRQQSRETPALQAFWRCCEAVCALAGAGSWESHTQNPEASQLRGIFLFPSGLWVSFRVPEEPLWTSLGPLGTELEELQGFGNVWYWWAVLFYTFLWKCAFDQ